MRVPLSCSLRAQTAQAVESGAAARAAVARFEVSPSSAVKLMPRVRTTGSAVPAKYGGQRDRRAARVRRADDRRDLPRLRRAGSRPSASAGRRRGQSVGTQARGRPEAIKAAGASVLYLPPYSLDLNPIEQVFAKLKTLPGKTAARIREALWEAIAIALDAYPQTNASTTSSMRDMRPRNTKTL